MKSLPLRFVARVTVEAATPFLVSTGRGDAFADAWFVADANGLPALPGSSIAGVLRHAYTAAHGEEKAESIFGFQRDDKGLASRLTVSWGVLHGTDNVPVEGLVSAQQLANDVVLRQAAISNRRDHVRIGPRGAAEDGGKFDEVSVAAGHRFTFELELEGSAADDPHWQELLQFLSSPEFRLGGKTRRGFGAFVLRALWVGTFNLATSADRARYASLPVNLAARATGLASQPEPVGEPTKSNALSVEAQLEPDGFWLIGGGFGGEADMQPITEERIKWDPVTGKGQLGTGELLIPATAVKGAIAHRVAFYDNAERKVFADSVPEDERGKVVGQGNPSVQALFGCTKDDDATSSGQRGRILIDDMYLGDEAAATTKFVNHVSIDRFTGGVLTLSGALFSEQPVYRGPAFTLKLTVSEPEDIDTIARRALRRSLEDLCSGRLAIGAGASRGNGMMRAVMPLAWSDGGAWIEGGR